MNALKRTMLPTRMQRYNHFLDWQPICSIFCKIASHDWYKYIYLVVIIYKDHVKQYILALFVVTLHFGKRDCRLHPLGSYRKPVPHSPARQFYRGCYNCNQPENNRIALPGNTAFREP